MMSQPSSSALRLNLGQEGLPPGSSNLRFVQVSILISQEAGEASCATGMHFSLTTNWE